MLVTRVRGPVYNKQVVITFRAGVSTSATAKENQFFWLSRFDDSANDFIEQRRISLRHCDTRLPHLHRLHSVRPCSPKFAPPCCGEDKAKEEKEKAFNPGYLL